VPLLTGDTKKSPFVKFHANQGLIVFLCGIAYSIVAAVLRAILGAIFPLRWNNLIYSRGAVYGILSAVIGLASLAILALAVLGILNAVNGKKKELPLVGGFKILK